MPSQPKTGSRCPATVSCGRRHRIAVAPGRTGASNECTNVRLRVAHVHAHTQSAWFYEVPGQVTERRARSSERPQSRPTSGGFSSLRSSSSTLMTPTQRRRHPEDIGTSLCAAASVCVCVFESNYRSMRCVRWHRHRTNYPLRVSRAAMGRGGGWCFGEYTINWV